MVNAKTTNTNSEIKKPKKTTRKEAESLTLDVYNPDGTVAETMELPISVFGKPVNTQLVAQAVRVYLQNQRQGTAKSKTRGEVSFSTRKIYRQKGTGGARHGGKGAPIFVGGGTAHGPKVRDYSLSFPKKMKQAALLSALTDKIHKGGLKVVTGLETVEPKTKNMAKVFMTLQPEKKRTLFISAPSTDGVIRSTRNLEDLLSVSVSSVTTYDVYTATHVIVMKQAFETFIKRYG